MNWKLLSDIAQGIVRALAAGGAAWMADHSQHFTTGDPTLDSYASASIFVLVIVWSMYHKLQTKG